MAKLRLKKTILEIVDNQLKENNPTCTKDTYEKLMNAGYSSRKQRIKLSSCTDGNL